LTIPLQLRTQGDIRCIASLLLDFKFFTELAALRVTQEPGLMEKIAAVAELVEYRQSEVVARQGEVQERPRFLMGGEVIMQREIKDSEETKDIN